MILYKLRILTLYSIIDFFMENVELDFFIVSLILSVNTH